MTKLADQNILEAILDAWKRSNTILTNLLEALPEDGLEASPMAGSMPVAAQFAHIQNTRLFWLKQVAPEFAAGVTQLFRNDGEERIAERDPRRIAQALNEGAQAIGDAVVGRLETGQPMKSEHATYDHPVLLLAHMLWHEGYHVGQIKLALKAMGYVMSDEVEEKTIWSLWRTEMW